MTKESGDTATGQGQVNVKCEITALEAEAGTYFLTHDCALVLAGLKVYSTSRVRKLKISMPPASQWA